jgi:hypothetical protein
VKAMAWGVFLAFILVSAAANFAHGDDRLAGALMAVVPIGFAAVITLLENMVARGKGSWPLYVAAGVVGLGAGVASYVGLMTMALDHKVPGPVAVLLPLAYDGVVAVASLAIRSLGSDHTDLVQPDRVSTHQNPSTPAQEMAQDPARRGAQAAEQVALSTPEQADVEAVSTPSTEQGAHGETAAQRPSTPAEHPARGSSVAPAQDMPEHPAPSTPRAPRKAAQKKAPSTPVSSSPEQAAQAAAAVLSGELSQVKAAQKFGVSRGAVQRAIEVKKKSGEHPAPAEADLEGVDLSEELDNTLAEILGRKNDDET